MRGTPPSLTVYAIQMLLGWEFQNATKSGVLGHTSVTNPTDRELLEELIARLPIEYAETSEYWTVDGLAEGRKRLEFLSF